VILIYTVKSSKSLGSDRGKKTSTQNDDKLIADKIRICYLLKIHLVKQELLTFPKHLSPPPVFSGVGVTRCLVLCVCFVDRCLSFCTISFGHCVVCSSSIYDSDYTCGIFKPSHIFAEIFA
jgi:hypothetical protein